MKFLFFFLLLSCKLQAQFVKEEKKLITPSGTLQGTLYIPVKKQAALKLIIIQPGSGPTDRNGNNPLGVKASSYRMLAESLSVRNIATLLIDKRCVATGIAACKGEKDLRFDDYANDLAEWTLLMQKDTRVRKVFIAGHSEGSLVGMIAAQKVKTAGYISLEGAGERIDKIISWQLANQDQVHAHAFDSLVNRLQEGKKIDTVPAYLMSVLRPSLQLYMISWIQHDPCNELRHLRCPILIIQGTRDIQTNETQGEMLHRCVPKALYQVISEMSHILKSGSEDPKENFNSYKDPGLSLSPDLVKILSKFIAKH